MIHAAQRTFDAPRLLRGYILLETIVSMVVLSAGAFAVHRGIQQALLLRGQARDYTQVRFLIENLAAKLDLQPQLTAGEDSGDFPGELSRFHYHWEITRIDLPVPPLPRTASLLEVPPLTYSYVARLRITITWERNGVPFEEHAETILMPDRLFVPPEELRQAAELGAATRGRP